MKNSRAFFRCALIIAILSFPSILVQSGEMFSLQPNSSAQNPPTLESSAIKSADSVDSRYLFLSKKTLDPVDEEQFLKTISRESLKGGKAISSPYFCLLYTSDAADDLLCVDLGGRRIIKKKNKKKQQKKKTQKKKHTQT